MSTNKSIPSSHDAEKVLRANNDGWENVKLSSVSPGPGEYWFEQSGTHKNGLPCRLIYSKLTGWHEVHGGICNTWLIDHGGPGGHLGLPISDEKPCPEMGEGVRISYFQNGCLWWSPKDWDVVQCCTDKISLELTHNPLTIETNLRVNGHPCNDAWFVDLVGSDDAPRRLQMWVDRFFPAFRKAFSFAKSATLKFRGVAFDCEDIQQVAADALQAGFPLELTTEECKSAEDKYKKLLSLYEEAKRLEYKPFEKVQELFRQIEDRVFNIGVVGPMKNGKSTLLNAIIGQELLPTQGQRCTAKICYIEHDPKAKSFQAKRDEEEADESLPQSTGNKGFLPASLDLLRQWNEDKSDHRSFTLRGRLANIHVPSSYKLTFVDTPGPDSAIYTEDAEEVEHFFEEDRASMMFCVYNYSNKAHHEALKRVKAKLKKFGRQIEDRMIFIVPRLDERTIPEDVSSENNPLVSDVKTIKEDLLKFGFRNPKIILVSAKIALDVRLFHGELNRALNAKRSGDVDSFRRQRKLLDEKNGACAVFCSKFERMGTTSLDISSISSSIRNPFVKEYKELENSNVRDKKSAFWRRCEILSGIPVLEKCVEEYLVKYLIPARVHEAAKEFRESIRSADLASRALEKIKEDESAKDKLIADLRKVEDLESGNVIDDLKKKIRKHRGFPSSSFTEMRNNILNEVEECLHKIGNELKETLSKFDDKIQVDSANELKKSFEGKLRAVREEYRAKVESALQDEDNGFSAKVRTMCENTLKDVLEGTPFLSELLRQQQEDCPQLNWTDISIGDSCVHERTITRTIVRCFDRLREGVIGVVSWIFHGFRRKREEKHKETITVQEVLKKDFESNAKTSISSVKKSFQEALCDETLDKTLFPIAERYIHKIDGFFKDTSWLREDIAKFTNQIRTTQRERDRHEAMLQRVRQLGDQLQSLLELEPAALVVGHS